MQFVGGVKEWLILEHPGVSVTTLNSASNLEKEASILPQYEGFSKHRGKKLKEIRAIKCGEKEEKNVVNIVNTVLNMCKNNKLYDSAVRTDSPEFCSMQVNTHREQSYIFKPNNRFRASLMYRKN